MKYFLAAAVGICIAFAMTSCAKIGVMGHISHAFGNWAQVNLPDNCVPKQVAAEEGSGVVVLCADGRVFH